MHVTLALHKDDKTQILTTLNPATTPADPDLLSALQFFQPTHHLTSGAVY
jgi:hypothetical protein